MTVEQDKLESGGKFRGTKNSRSWLFQDVGRSMRTTISFYNGNTKPVN